MKTANQPQTQALVPVEIEPLPLEIPTDIPDPLVTEKEATEIFKRMGLTALPSTVVGDMARLGGYLEGVGVVRTTRGQLLLTQQRLGDVLMVFHTALVNEAKSNKKVRLMNMTKLGHEMAYIASKLTEAQKLMLETVGGLARDSRGRSAAILPKDTAPSARSFLPGQDVQPGGGNTTIMSKEVHIHNPAPLQSPVPPC